MYEKRKRDLQRLTKFNLLVVTTYWSWLLIKQTYLKQSLPMRLVPLHAVFMLVVIFGFPGSFPIFVLAPVLFAAAYYATLILLFILPRPRVGAGSSRPHWVK